MDLLAKANARLLNFLVTTPNTNPTNPTESGISFLNQAVEWLTDWGWTIALVCMVIVGIIFMIPSEQSSQKGKRYALYTTAFKKSDKT